METRKPISALACLVAASIACFAPAQRSSLNDQDRQFVVKAAQGNSGEILLGQLALQHGTGGFGKTYGRMMVDAHDAANDRLLALAQRKGIHASNEPDAASIEAAQRLRNLRGAEFDGAYRNLMIRRHDQALKLYQTQASRGRDRDIRRYASSMIGHIQHHLRDARNLMPAARGSDTWSSRQLSSKDRWFLTHAYQVGLGEIRLGNLAKQHGTGGFAERFGSEMVEQHTEWNRRLREIARDTNFDLTSSLTDEYAGAVSRLSRLRGAEFDGIYRLTEIRNHEAMIRLMEGQINEGSNAALKAFARETLPTIRRHLADARRR